VKSPIIVSLALRRINFGYNNYCNIHLMNYSNNNWFYKICLEILKKYFNKKVRFTQISKQYKSIVVMIYITLIGFYNNSWYYTFYTKYWTNATLCIM